ncbi:universal stress protein [Novosphingobium sp. G106]|uniref:universal stress protein n=1 Tax=Novosphingobium sp. G106 TaxID=2849500 RepID=UPI001C2DB752|nr:universal stress protein [Novosphingobium sp. G106]MBV1691356.1 universal stress protein [Novosphingobium sp. G106]
MRKILVATDFSPRSDRALRRGVLLAHQVDAEIVMIHALDDDLPSSIISTQRNAAETLLSETASSIRQIDGIACSYALAFGDPFKALLDAASEMQPELIVMGPHRRNLLKDVFVGTTAERIIRECGIPIISAGGVPAGYYQRVTIATDLSESSWCAVSTAQKLGLLDATDVSLLHVLETSETTRLQRSFRSTQAIEDHVLSARAEAMQCLQALAGDAGVVPDRMKVEALKFSIADTIKSIVATAGSDLLVIGTHGRSGFQRLFLGKVAEELLRGADVDILAVGLPHACLN